MNIVVICIAILVTVTVVIHCCYYDCVYSFAVAWSVISALVLVLDPSCSLRSSASQAFIVSIAPLFRVQGLGFRVEGRPMQ